jgi:hypothetical protein
MNAMPASAFLVHLETDEAILLLRGHNELPIAEQVCRKAALLQDVRQRPVYDQNTDHGWMSKAPAGLRSSLAYTVHLAPAAGTCVAEGSLLNLWSDHTARSVAYRKGRAYLFDLESNANSHRTGSAHLTGHI